MATTGHRNGRVVVAAPAVLAVALKSTGRRNIKQAVGDVERSLRSFPDTVWVEVGMLDVKYFYLLLRVEY